MVLFIILGIAPGDEVVFVSLVHLEVYDYLPTTGSTTPKIPIRYYTPLDSLCSCGLRFKCRDKSL